MLERVNQEKVETGGRLLRSITEMITRAVVVLSLSIEKKRTSTILPTSTVTTTGVVRLRRNSRGAGVAAEKTVGITEKVTGVGPQIARPAVPEQAPKKIGEGKKNHQISSNHRDIMRKSPVGATNDLVETVTVSESRRGGITARIRIARDVEVKVTTETAKKVVRDARSDTLPKRKTSLQEFQHKITQFTKI